LFDKHENTDMTDKMDFSETYLTTETVSRLT